MKEKEIKDDLHDFRNLVLSSPKNIEIQIIKPTFFNFDSKIVESFCNKCKKERSFEFITNVGIDPYFNSAYYDNFKPVKGFDCYQYFQDCFMENTEKEWEKVKDLNNFENKAWYFMRAICRHDSEHEIEVLIKTIQNKNKYFFIKYYQSENVDSKNNFSYLINHESNNKYKKLIKKYEKSKNNALYLSAFLYIRIIFEKVIINFAKKINHTWNKEDRMLGKKINSIKDKITQDITKQKFLHKISQVLGKTIHYENEEKLEENEKFAKNEIDLMEFIIKDIIIYEMKYTDEREKRKNEFNNKAEKYLDKNKHVEKIDNKK